MLTRLTRFTRLTRLSLNTAASAESHAHRHTHRHTHTHTHTHSSAYTRPITLAAKALGLFGVSLGAYALSEALSADAPFSPDAPLSAFEYDAQCGESAFAACLGAESRFTALQRALSLVMPSTVHCRPSSPSRAHHNDKAAFPIYRVALTGGPCGGKTTAITTIIEQMKERGFNVYVVPEVATVLMTGGVSPMVGGDLSVFEESIMKIQMNMEDVYYEIAMASGKPSIIICDRGVMDCMAYLKPLEWETIVDKNEWNNIRMRDGRYDVVIHLVTAAIGAESFYTTANSNTRTETPEQAIEKDLKTREAWNGHPYLRIIDNSTNFSAKIDRVIDVICLMVGLPSSDRIVKKKFLLTQEPDWSRWPVPFKSFDVEQTFLTTNDGSEMCVTRRGQTGSYSYSLRTIKLELKNGVPVQTILKRKISSREYVSYLAQEDSTRGTIRLKRHCFLWQNSYYVVDAVYNLRILENGDLAQSDKESDCVHIVRIEMDRSEADKLSHPAQLNVSKEVTEDVRYKFVNLSLKCQK
eukprot:TRINITY_DN771_c0_g1_i10.p1 TRINITY_DN771_c0_g1~~TRINITY_DN771_c0_g1_i10.p1  ORF type:complete len:524 (+),score=100.18 TRINITY_DN771_c0_g1_i10:86-1657(+)